MEIKKLYIIAYILFLLFLAMMMIGSLCTYGVFSDGIQNIKTVSALFLIQNSFNMNFIIKKTYDLYKEQNTNRNENTNTNTNENTNTNTNTNRNEIINIIIINIILLLTITIIVTPEKRQIIIYSAWSLMIVICGENNIKRYNIYIERENIINNLQQRHNIYIERDERENIINNLQNINQETMV